DLAYTLAAQLGTLLESRQLAGRAPQGEHVSLATGTRATTKVNAPPFVRAQTAFGGVADGIVTVLQTQQAWDTVYFTESEDPEGEVALLDRGLERAREESRRLRQRAGEIFAEIDAQIFE